MKATQTEVDFERMSWHDCHIWRLDFRIGDPEEEDWTSDLVIGLDFIVEWLCGIGGGAQFKIAPAKLVFRGVTDPKIAIDWGSSGFQTAIYQLSIDQILREPVQEQKVYLDQPYYRWSILLNSPKGAEITFGATGFTQTLLAEPLVCEQQFLSLKERNRLTSR